MTKLELQDLIGKRLVLISMQGEDSLVEGDKGEVIFIDSINQIHVKWDNGSTLALIPETDSYRILTPEEVQDDLSNDIVGY